MKIAIAADHAGVDLKSKVVEFLKSKSHGIVDFGPQTLESVDYPDYAQKVCLSILKGESELGILICGTGVGMSIAANKCKGIRAALVFTPFMGTMARVHNNANVLCLGAKTTEHNLALEIVQSWLIAQFEGGRHEARLKKLSALEELL